jgi:hypothetical protein
MKTGALTLEDQAALMRLIAFCWTGSIRKSTLFDPAGMARLLGGISERRPSAWLRSFMNSLSLQRKTQTGLCQMCRGLS